MTFKIIITADYTSYLVQFVASRSSLSSIMVNILLIAQLLFSAYRSESRKSIESGVFFLCNLYSFLLMSTIFILIMQFLVQFRCTINKYDVRCARNTICFIFVGLVYIGHGVKVSHHFAFNCVFLFFHQDFSHQFFRFKWIKSPCFGSRAIQKS